MKFKHGTRRKPLEYEKDLVDYWKKNKTFQKSIEQRPKNESYVFYDGPPFITGEPHYGTLLSSIVKDAVPRYWTMKGKRVERVWGWDCHGLPAEVFVENKLGIKDRREIGTKISLEEYIVACRKNMVQTGNEWEDIIDRIGRWVDFKGAYKTMDKNYMESVWWAFKQLYEKEMIYEGEKVLLYCTRDATPLSKAEVTMDAGAYKDVVTPSVYVKFKLENEDKYLLAWTTTPWTLPSNSAVAVNSRLMYAEVELDGEVFILAENLLDKALTDEKHQPLPYKKLKSYLGEELVGKKYVPLFEVVKELEHENAFKVWNGEFVHDEEGTGVAHESPAYGEDDYVLSKLNNVPWVISTDENGIFNMGDWKGSLVWDVNKQIAKELKERGIVWKIDYIEHSYPHCHRCGTKLMYRAHPSWFVDIQRFKEDMLKENQEIYWFPEHFKNGRFQKNIESSPDWNVSRDRFWATPLPVWKGIDSNGKESTVVVGSYQELKELSGMELDDYHRPWVDDIKFIKDGVEYSRIEKVMDSWFEAGSMPFAQFHYPFENVEKFESNFPGDFIAEYVGQVRAWFYYLHAVSVGLFGKESFKNVIVTGTLAGNDGRKMSKSYGNFTDPNELMDTNSADALRFALLSSPVLNGEDFSLIDKDVSDVSRKLVMVWNMYDFFTMYAEVDNWEWDGNLADPHPTLTNELDIWIISRLHQLIDEVSEHLDSYDLPGGLKPVIPFIEDASNWYVRRSRRRFWKSEDDQDKADAYKTLHYVLVKLAHVLAPFTPFMADELYIKLTGGESVHLNDWPSGGYIDDILVSEAAIIREIITQGLSQRADKGLKVRQPLESVDIISTLTLSDYSKSMIAEELNVKKVHVSEGDEISTVINTKLNDELISEGRMRELIRVIQNQRKKTGLNIDDRVHLTLSGDAELMKVISTHKDEIAREVLAKTLSAEGSNSGETVDVKVDGLALSITLAKA